MYFEIEAAGRIRQVDVVRTGATFAVTVDGHTRQVDPARIGEHTLSLLVDSVWPNDVVMVRDRVTGQLSVGVGGSTIQVGVNGRRKIRPGAAAHGGAGPQQLVAPMPGKVVRVLAAAGDAVRHGQPLVVVEAMKMENELRAGRDGVVAELLVGEGQSVEAGTLLAVIQ